MTISQREEEGKGLLPFILFFSPAKKHILSPPLLVSSFTQFFSNNKTEETDKQKSLGCSLFFRNKRIKTNT